MAAYHVCGHYPRRVLALEIPLHGTPGYIDVLRFYVLGPFEAWRDDEPILADSFRTRQTLNLLKLLLVERDQVVPFERITDQIWPESGPANARQSLRVAIRTVRLALEPELSRGADSGYIRTGPGGYRFDSSSCLLDADQFLSARQRGLAAERRGAAGEAIDAYREALALYRGEYLADNPYDDWAISARERFQNSYLDVLERLIELQTRAGDWERAIALTERALAADPFREDLYRQLMRCHAALGRRSHALSVFEQCRRLLRSELSLEPAAATVALRDEIVDRQPLADSAPVKFPVGLPADELHAAFVGRPGEIQALGDAWRRAGTEGGSIVHLTGVPGVGKTRLAQRFAEQVELAPVAEPPGSNARGFWIQAYETETQLPFAPLARLLASWLERSPSIGDRQRMSRYVPVLGQLLPQMSELWPDVRPQTSGQATLSLESSQLFEALTQAALIMMGDGPALLVLDDAHWADDSTFRWLGYALRRFPPGVLVLAISRSSEPAPELLQQLLSAARRANQLTSLTLYPLTPADVEQLLAARILQLDDRSAVGRRLYQATDGLPLFVVETLRELLNQGLLYDDGAGGWRATGIGGDVWDAAFASTTIRETILGRVARLDRGERNALNALCVIGGECSAQLASQVTGDRLEQTLTALDGLLERQFARTTRTGRGYAVEHSLIQRVVYDDLSPGRRQEWHLRAAAALQRLYADRPAAGAAQLLHHLIAGATAANEIIEAGEQAGDYALNHHAYAEAASHYTVSLEHLGALLPDLEVAARIDGVLERRADAYAGQGRWDDATGVYRGLITSSRSPLARGRLRRKLARALGDVQGRFDEALEILNRAEADLPVSDQPEVRIELGRIESARTAAYLLRGDYLDLIEHGERALSLWQDLPGVEIDRLELVLRIGQAQQRLGNLDPAEERYRWVNARARTIGDRLIEARSLDALGAVYFHRGRLSDALAALGDVVRLARDIGAPRQEIVGLTNYANTLTHLGELRQAQEAYQTVLERAATLDAHYTVMHVTVGLGEVLTRLGEFDVARDALERGIAMAAEIGNQQRGGHAYLYLAELALLEGNPGAARADAERGIANGRRINDAHVLREGCPLLAQALIAHGEYEAAEQAALNGLEVARAGGFTLSAGRNLRVLGQALAAGGRLKAAEDALDEAEHIFRSAGAGYDLAYSLFTRAVTFASDQRRDAALAEALDLARIAGAQPLAKMIEDASTHS